jgi:hypothetical protein
LSDPEKREIYDQYGEDALKEGMGGGGSHADPFDIFSSFFGPSFGGIVPYSSVPLFLLCFIINVITGLYMFSLQEVVEAAGEEGKGGEKM